MSDDATEAELVALRVVVELTMRDARDFMRWLTRRVWLLRAIALMNVTFGAWDASGIAGATYPWLNAAGAVACAFGTWRALSVEGDMQADITRVRERLRELDKKAKTIEREMNASRA